MHDIFPQQYHKEVIKYKNLIKSLYTEYDVLIFMARKAICFYKSMVINGLIDPPKKDSEVYIFSSRTLDYNIFGKLVGKKIAIIDDVVIKGRALTHVLDRFKKNAIYPDVYVVECTEDFVVDVKRQIGNRLKETYGVLSKDNTLMLSQYITQYIEASMCPYNIDQPIYQINFLNEGEALNFLENSNTSILTSSRQKKFNVQNHIMHFSNLSCTFADVCDAKQISMAKIRFLYKKGTNSIIAIPFVLLHEMNYCDLDRSYSKISTVELDEFVQVLNEEKISYENKYKVLYYFLADCLMNAFVSKLSDDLPYATFEKLNSNDYYSFSCNVLGMISKNFDFNNVSLHRENTHNDSFEFNEYLNSAYNYIFSGEVDKQNYFDAKGNRIEGTIVTVANLQTYVEKCVYNFNRFLLYNIFDVLIDNGILVPSIIHSDGGKILRSYKSGEIYQLNVEHFRVFAKMLGQYSNKVDRPLFRTEFEKLCVLFFRRIGKLLTPIEEKAPYTLDEYSVCYSLYGPRISLSNLEYAVQRDSTLESKLREELYIRETNWVDVYGKYHKNMYQVKYHEYISINDMRWKVEATAFAINYANLYKTFQSKIDNLKGSNIYTFIDFLTLLSIGLDKRNQLLSLLAELHLFTNLEIDQNKGIKDVLRKINTSTILDGFISGMWKYMCYSRKVHPLEVIMSKMLEEDEQMITFFHSDIVDEFDKSNWIFDSIKECGKLLYRIMYTVFYLCQKHKVDYKINVNDDKQRHFYVFRHYEFGSLMSDVESQTSFISMNESLYLLAELQKQAKGCIDSFEKNDARMNSKPSNEAVTGSRYNIQAEQVTIIDNVEKQTIHYIKGSRLDWEVIEVELLKVLNEFSSDTVNASSEAREALEYKSESKLKVVLKKIVDTGADVFTKVTAEFLVAYMRANGILPRQ